MCGQKTAAIALLHMLIRISALSEARVLPFGMICNIDSALAFDWKY